MQVKPKKMNIQGQPSWKMSSSTVELYLTELGGQLGPVTFDRKKRKIRPYSVAPWAAENLKTLPPIIRALRGDFFCMPFGGNHTPYGQENYPIHGETANGRWKFLSCETRENIQLFQALLKTKIRKGQVNKKIMLIDGEDVVYCQHVISGLSGPMNFGHHAMLKFPSRPGSGLISTSPFVHGQVFVKAFERAEEQGYFSLKTGAEFDSLEKVPTSAGGTADLTRYPARQGYEDLVMIVPDPESDFSWTAVTFPKEGYVWFALKDPRVLAETVFWLSNGGRYYFPWNGRHLGVMGLEDVTAYFHFGLAESAENNPIAKMGYPTCQRLKPDQPLAINYIMGVTSVPKGFGHVKEIEEANGQIVLKSQTGETARAKVSLDFLSSPADFCL